MANEIIPSVQTALSLFPQNQKNNFDRAMEVGRLILRSNAGIAGTIANGLNSMFQTYALIQARHDIAKIVKYTSAYEIEMKRLDNEAKRDLYQYDLQRDVLTLYVDRRYQDYVDRITHEAQRIARNIESVRSQTILAIDEQTKAITVGLNQQYRDMLRQEEAVCAVYRNFIYDLSKQNISRHDLACQLGLQAINNSRTLSERQFEMVMDTVERMTEPRYVTFDQFVGLGNVIRRNNLMG